MIDTSSTDRGSLVRILIGAALFLFAVVTAVYGFLRLATVLDAGGYGTASMRQALGVLGLAGASLAAGIATIIWDLSKRFER